MNPIQGQSYPLQCAYSRCLFRLANGKPDSGRIFVIQAYTVQTTERFYDLFSIFEKRVKLRGGIALVHYGGHGIQVGVENYLLPTQQSIPDEGRIRTRTINVAEITFYITKN